MAGKFGSCSDCGSSLVPIYFEQEEERFDHHFGLYIKTGRKRTAVDVLVCPSCLKEECVDDSLDVEWHY